jgi:hypothetical protein
LGPAAAALLAALFPDALYSLLEAQIKALPNNGVAGVERGPRRDALEAQLEQLERDEESLIESAHEAGHDIGRRSDASPWAVLGVTAETLSNGPTLAVPQPAPQPAALH